MATTRYVWEKWDAIAIKYKLYSKVYSSSSVVNSGISYKNYTFDSATGKITWGEQGRNTYTLAYGENTNWYNSRDSASFYFSEQGYNKYDTYTEFAQSTLYTVSPSEWKIGNTNNGLYAAASSTSAPNNGYDAVTGYWYIQKGSDNIDPVSVTHKTTIEPGKIDITIVPSTGNVYGGTITYTIQTTTDGSNWVTDGTTTESSYTVTVPEDADKFGVRVFAKDDMGFTSSTDVYGNGTQTPYSVIHVSANPLPGDIGYIATPRIMEIGVESKETSYSFKATLSEIELANIASTSEPVQEITMSDSQFAGLSADTPYTLTVEIGQTGGTVSKNYTFRKFAYDDSTLSGVFDGTARALREKLGMTDKILGAKFPEKVFDLPRLPSITATPEKVFSGYTFADKFGKIRVGAPAKTTAAAKDIAHGLTAYDNYGNLMTGTGSSVRIQVGYIPNAGSGITSGSKTHKIYYNNSSLGAPHMIIAWFDTWGPYNVSNSANVKNYSFSPYLNAGSITGKLFETAGGALSGSYTFRNQNQTGANSTMSVGSTYVAFNVSYNDYVSSNDLCYIFLW